MLSLCILLNSDHLMQPLLQALQVEPLSAPQHERYEIIPFQDPTEFLTYVEQHKQQVECLILEDSPEMPPTLKHLQECAVYLPLVILVHAMEGSPEGSLEAAPKLENGSLPFAAASDLTGVYHTAALRLAIAHLTHLTPTIDEAIRQFLQLPPLQLPNSTSAPSPISTLTVQSSLTQQQQRLSEKLKQRLGYLGIYYKRNPAHFLRHMSQQDRQELLDQLRIDYRQIVLNYFLDDPELNEKIDNFVNVAFFADVPISQVVEIHMNLMDEFTKQLRLEGRSDDVVLDYRLTLIDTLAHLCEMYRRSIPRES